MSDLKQRLSDTNGKLARLVAAIEAGGDVEVLNPRIAALSTERQLTYRRNLRPAGAAEIRALLSALRGLVSVLESADPTERAMVYADLGVSLRYDPRNQTVHATRRSLVCRKRACRRGDRPRKHTGGAVR